MLSVAICLLAGIGWSSAALVAAWGAIVGGPFFGVSLLMKQVCALDSGPIDVPLPATIALAALPHPHAA